VKRHAEGEREDNGQRQQDRPAAKNVGESSYRDGRDGQQDDDARGVVAQVDDLRVVPLVAEDQDGK
jgi:hypothetical protein